MRKSTLLLIVIVIILIGAGIAVAHKSGKNNQNQNQTYNQTSQTATKSNNNASSGTIDIRNMMFTPSQITVSKGGSVTWTNNDTTTHTVVDDLSNVGGPNSGDIAPGQTYSF